MSTAVNHPQHYGGGNNLYEAIKVIEAWNLDFCLGNTVKYISRAGKKDAAKLIEDLKKAAWYLERKINSLEVDDQSAAELGPPTQEIIEFLKGNMYSEPGALYGIYDEIHSSFESKFYPVQPAKFNKMLLVLPEFWEEVESVEVRDARTTKMIHITFKLTR